MSWRVALIDSCGEWPAAVDAVSFISMGDRVERCAVVPDPTGHGTRIAGVIMRSAPELLLPQLLLAQVFTSAGPTTAAAVAAAVDWAVASRAQLIHLSLGLAVNRAVLEQAVAVAVAAGCVLVASSPARGAGVFPASYPGVIRGTGDARCARDEISVLEPWLFGASPRADSGVGNGAGATGGASIGAAGVTAAVLSERPGLAARDVVSALSARAVYVGRERRGANPHDQGGFAH